MEPQKLVVCVDVSGIFLSGLFSGEPAVGFQGGYPSKVNCWDLPRGKKGFQSGIPKNIDNEFVTNKLFLFFFVDLSFNQELY